MALMNDQKIDKRSKAYKDGLLNSNTLPESAPQEQSTTVNETDPRDKLIQDMQTQELVTETKLENAIKENGKLIGVLTRMRKDLIAGVF